MGRHRLTIWLKRLAAFVTFKRASTTEAIAAVAAVAAPIAAAPVSVSVAQAPRRMARPLAAQLASQARLNVPVGKTPRVAKPKAGKVAKPLKSVNVAKAKRAPQPRSVFLQARHLSAKPAPKFAGNVVAMPKAATRPGSNRLATVRPGRVAA